MVENISEYFVCPCSNSQKYKLQIPHQILQFYEKEIYQMFKVGVSATLIHRVVWYRPFHFLETI